MKVPSFDISDADETALLVCKQYLEAVTDGGIRITTVAAVRWALHRAAAGVAAEIAPQEQEGGLNGDSR
jgi:NAD(P)H-dependent flavin oxidoreductase YrpB (nitropropane dioxygenase family)